MIRQVFGWEELSLPTNQEIHRNRATRNLESKEEIRRSSMYFRNIVTMGIYTSVYILHLNGIVCSFASMLIYEYFIPQHKTSLVLSAADFEQRSRSWMSMDFVSNSRGLP
jgi:hypothetical protein